jgi:hypothetical protein
MTRSAVTIALLGLLVASQGFVQDLPGGPPVGLRLEVLEAPSPWYVAGKPALLKIVAVDQYGRPSLANGIAVRTKTSDPKSKLNNFDVGLVNGTATLKLKWFTPSDKHSIQASGTGGIKGETNGIEVQALPKDLRFKLLKPESWPNYVWAGGYFKARGQLLTAGEEPVGNVQVSFATSRGTVIMPGDVVTDPDTGDFEFDCFAPEFICPGDEGGGGGVNGDRDISVKCFVDANGDGIANGDAEPGDEMPPAHPVSACPQELIPCALRILCILEEGGVFPPPSGGDGGIIVTGLSPTGKAKGKDRSDLAKISAAKQFLQEQVIDFVNSGKWNGKFSTVRSRLDHCVRFLRDVPEASPATDRLACASKLMAGIPDVRDLHLSNQVTRGSRIEQTARTTAVYGVTSVGVGKRAIADSEFGRCFQPTLTRVLAEGPGSVRILSIGPPPSFENVCTAPGRLDVSADILYRPLEAIIVLPPGEGGGGEASVSSAAVQGGASEGGEIGFHLLDSLLIIQNKGFLMLVHKPLAEKDALIDAAKRRPEGEGAFAVANLNDSDNDGHRDSEEGLTAPSKDEPDKARVPADKDLIRIEFDIPDDVPETAVIEFTGNEGAKDNVRIWNSRDKAFDKDRRWPQKVPFQLSAGFFRKPKQQRGAIWVEGLKASKDLGDCDHDGEAPARRRTDG